MKTDNKTIAIYIRLSLADEETGRTKDESNSIVNQRIMIHRFLDHHEELSGWKREEFADDGFSGTNTDRPAFQEMISRIRQGKIQACITKDFSRFARDYIEMGDYLECLFPFLGVRYISINDNYDSDDYKGTTGGLDVVMRSIVYAAYSKDLSVKVTTGKRQSMKKGRRVQGFPPYGYMKDPDHKGMDIPDPETAPVVRRIFEMKIGGSSNREIANKLNEEGILTPGKYFMKNNPDTKMYSFTSDVQPWTYMMIDTILKRYTYTGASVGHIREQIVPCKRGTRPVDRKDWIVVPGMHEAIVSEEEYELANQFRKPRTTERKPAPRYPLKSLLVCGRCGRKMERINRKYFRCRKANAEGIRSCKDIKSPPEPELEEMVFSAIRNLIKSCSLKQQKNGALNRKHDSGKSLLHLSDLQKGIDKLQREKFKAYERYSSSELSKEEYLKEKVRLDKELKKRQEELEAEEQALAAAEQHIEFAGSEAEAVCKTFESEEKLTYEMAHAFVKQIVVSADNVIDIQMNFSDSDFWA